MADYKNFTVEIDADGIALVTWNMPDRSMNVFTEEVMDEFETIIGRVAADADVKGAASDPAYALERMVLRVAGARSGR